MSASVFALGICRATVLQYCTFGFHFQFMLSSNVLKCYASRSSYVAASCSEMATDSGSLMPSCEVRQGNWDENCNSDGFAYKAGRGVRVFLFKPLRNYISVWTFSAPAVQLKDFSGCDHCWKHWKCKDKTKHTPHVNACWGISMRKCYILYLLVSHRICNEFYF